MCSAFRWTTVILAISACPLSCWGGVLSTRSELETALGGVSTTDDFQSFNFTGGYQADTFDNGNPSNLGGTNTLGHLNSTTLVRSHEPSSVTQGPGLVGANVDYYFGNGLLQWNDTGYFGSTSKTVSSLGGGLNSVTVDFICSTLAFGLDISTFDTLTTGLFIPNDGFSMTVYGVDDTTVLYDTDDHGGNIHFTGPFSFLPQYNYLPLFIGFEDLSGIGKVTFTLDGVFGYGPSIDNVEYFINSTCPTENGAVPEPVSLAIWGLGALGCAIAGYRRQQKTRLSN